MAKPEIVPYRTSFLLGLYELSFDPHFVVVNLVSGVAIGIGFAGIMLVSDTCGIRSLIQGEPNWLLPAAVFVGGSIPSFTALVFSTAIFLGADGKSGSAPPW